MRLFIVTAAIVLVVCQSIIAETSKPSSDKKTEELKDLIIKAEEGDIPAQLSLGLRCIKGKGVIKDYKMAVKWYRKAAEQGHASAQYNLGLMYDNGYGVIEDKTKAVTWYRKAAGQGYAPAQCGLGVIYEFGYAVIEDHKEAVKWYRKAAEQGYARAQYALGVMYDFGKGGIKNDKEAIKWYRKATDQGLASAKYNLGVLEGRSDGDLNIDLFIFGHFLCGIIGAGMMCFYYKPGSRHYFFCKMGFGIILGYLIFLTAFFYSIDKFIIKKITGG